MRARPDGSGKTTTIAAMIDSINETQAKHIVTIEDPIEVLHGDKRSLVNQREIGSDTEDYAVALKRVLRQDPDVIFIGEMRDPETVGAALTAANTGHLVFSPAHGQRHRAVTGSSILPPHHRPCTLVAGVPGGIVSHRLLDGSTGRSASRLECWWPPAGLDKIVILRDPRARAIIAEVGTTGETFDQSPSPVHDVLIGLRDALPPQPFPRPADALRSRLPVEHPATLT